MKSQKGVEQISIHYRKDQASPFICFFNFRCPVDLDMYVSKENVKLVFILYIVPKHHLSKTFLSHF